MSQGRQKRKHYRTLRMNLKKDGKIHFSIWEDTAVDKRYEEVMLAIEGMERCILKGTCERRVKM